jgi:hypothetical protein
MLHDFEQSLGLARRHPHRICCRLTFKGRRREIMTPDRHTELFFLDQAAALAAAERRWLDAAEALERAQA